MKTSHHVYHHREECVEVSDRAAIDPYQRDHDDYYTALVKDQP